MVPTKHLLLLAALVAAIASCHDSRRSNPVDPDLTPPIELAATLDDTSGSVTLTWSRYAGSAPFAGYLVLRDADDSRQVDTLQRLDGVELTTFTDSSLAPDIGYEYRVSVLTADGYEATSVARAAPAYSVRAVRGLAATPDSLAGSIILRWDRYADADFDGYRVVRTAIGTDRADTIAVHASRADTAFADTSARHQVSYLYSVVTAAAGRLLRSEPVAARMVLPAPGNLQAQLASARAAADLTWEAYAGPHFESYEILRRTSFLSPVTVAHLATAGDTALSDGGLLGDTQYTWQVVVYTTRGESVESSAVSGAFHQVVESQSLAELGSRFLRLIPTDRGVVGLAGRTGDVDAPYFVRLSRGVAFDAHLLTRLRALGSGLAIAVATVAGQDYFAVASDGSRWTVPNSVHLFSGDTTIVSRISFTDPFALGPEHAQVTGEIHLLGSSAFDNIVVSTAGAVQFSDDFHDVPFPTNEIFSADALRDWLVSAIYQYYTTNVGPELFLPTGSSLSRRDSTWQGFTLEVEAAISPSSDFTGAVQIGGATGSSYRLTLDGAAAEARLLWSFEPPAGSDLPARREEVSTPMAVGSMYRHLSLSTEGGAVSAVIASPDLWSRAQGQELPQTALATLGNRLALTSAGRAYALSVDGDELGSASLPSAASELRSWRDNRGRQRLGVCLPEENQILLGTIPEGSEADWPSFLSRAIGPQIGAGQGILAYPLSFDVGPDGRTFVLDAAAAQVIVFDSAGRYVTRFGGRGDGPGQFDFGQGIRNIQGNLDFSGSIAVDADGYVYVADERNARVQIFAP